MVKAVLYLEGGGDSKELRARCREGFRRLLDSCGFAKRRINLVACGGRGPAFDKFKSAHKKKASNEFIGLWIDSEDPLKNLEATWEHLKNRPGDNWEKPDGATDDQVLFMTTCMETWIVADRETLKKHFGSKLQVSALPPLEKLEERDRHDIFRRLKHATRNCSNPYQKGEDSFEILGKLSPTVLGQRDRISRPLLPSFVRVVEILEKQL